MWGIEERAMKFILLILQSHLVIEILLRDDWASKLRNSCLFQGYRVPRLCKHMAMYYFTLHPLIHNHAHPDYSYKMATPEFWLTHATLISFVLLKRTVSLLFSGLGGSFSAGLAENTCEQKLVCIHKWTDLSGRFDWKEMCFFPLSLLSFSLYKTPCEINATQTKYLETARSSSGTLNYGEAWGRWKLLFYFICSFPFSPSKPL